MSRAPVMRGKPYMVARKAQILRAMGKEELLARVAGGQTLLAIVSEIQKRVGPTQLPCSQWGLRRILQSYGEEYEEAKRAKAAYHADRVSMIADLVEHGMMDPQSARAASENHKWMAVKTDPQAYGERTQIDMTVTDLGKLHLAALKARLAMVREARGEIRAALPLQPGEVVKRYTEEEEAEHKEHQRI